MADFDAYLKAFATLVCLAFAFVILSGGNRRGAPLWLAGFLLLIAGNQAAETVRALAPDGTTADIVAWRAANVFAALDPLALYLFAQTAATAAVKRRWPFVVFGACTALLLSITGWLGTGDIREEASQAILLLYTAIVYTLVAARFLRAYAHEPSAASARILFIACALVAVRPWRETPYFAAPLLAQIFSFDLGCCIMLRVSAIWWSVLLGGVGICIALAARLPNRATTMPTAIAGLALGFVVTAIFSASSVVTIPSGGFGPSPDAAYMPGLAILGRATAAVRWILFGGLVSAAILREDMLGMSLAHRRVAARGLVALGMIGFVGVLYAGSAIAFGAEAIRLRPMDLILLTATLIATQGFRPLIDGVAARVYGVPMPTDRAGALETYRRAIQQSIVEGRDPRSDVGLARLAAELGMSEPEAGRLASLADDPRPGPLVAGQRVGGRYHVRRLVGRGGAGRVFLARDETLDRDVVLKEVLHDEPGDEAALREARAAAGLHHPNVVIVHDIIPRQGASLLVTEYLPGGTLAERIALTGPLSAREGMRVLDGVLAGLEAIHERGLVHRDLKPENVLFAASGEPKIGDFGIARMRRGVTARFDEPDAFIGTPEFMAPEQRAGARATIVSDVYAVGRLARRSIRSPMPPEIDRVIARALADEPRDRYPSASAMRADLARCVVALNL